jgi:predicted SprT family Zn-dependent metalloprotease
MSQYQCKECGEHASVVRKIVSPKIEKALLCHVTCEFTDSLVDFLMFCALLVTKVIFRPKAQKPHSDQRRLFLFQGGVHYIQRLKNALSSFLKSS